MEQAMMPYQSYQLWQIERPKTAAEQYAADIRSGQFAAAVSRSARRAVTKTSQAAGGPRLLLAHGVRLRRLVIKPARYTAAG